MTIKSYFASKKWIALIQKAAWSFGLLGLTRVKSLTNQDICMVLPTVHRILMSLSFYEVHKVPMVRSFISSTWEKESIVTIVYAYH